MKILAIESSCDESAAAIIEDKGGRLSVLSNVVASQIEIHKKYGGVVPEVAARHHTVNILPVIKETLAKAKTKPSELSAIAVTAGPGLITSLFVGVETAKALAYAWKLPLIPVNHIEGHIYANWLSNPKIKFPAVILTVSGGHNLLVLMKNNLSYKIIGDTRDDAAGEAFDKGAKLLNLGYPGGPVIAAAANRHSHTKSTDIIFPRPMINDNNFDFSFSGLKTSLLYKLQKDKNWPSKTNEYAYEYQKAIVDVLVKKTIKAGKFHKAQTILLSGGVSANKFLRDSLAEAVKQNLPQTNFFMPELAYTTDNAAMIGAAGCFKFKAGKTISLEKLRANPNLEL
jgi:N6-L-threonylcarbamoyladenine synthase